MRPILEEFLEWAGPAPASARAEAANAFATAWLGSVLTEDEREQIETAMTVLLDDPAVEVRRALAEGLARSDRSPAHIVTALAADADPVAAIVAEHSPVILDSELVDMAAMRGEAIQCAIAGRPFLSRAVCAALGEVAGAPACLSLIGNPGARIPRFTLDRIVARHGDSPELRLALLDRPDLPIDVRQVLVGRLAEALRELIVTHRWASPERAIMVTRDAQECATIAAAFEAPADDMPALVAQLIEGRALTPAFLIRAVAAGQRLLFETALAALSKIPQERVAGLVASGRTGNLRALLQRAQLPATTFPAFIAAIDLIRSGAFEVGTASDYSRATALVDAIVKRIEASPDRELDQILALLRRFAREAKRSAARGVAEQIREAA